MNENDMLRHVLSYPGLFDAIFDGLTQTAQTAVPDTVLDRSSASISMAAATPSMPPTA